MKAIRGATTVKCDEPEEIRAKVKELLYEIKKKNGIRENDIVCMMFSSTADIRSLYPAKAAREEGYATCALYSSLEPEIDGALKLCIRVMILVDSDRFPVHVYLHAAADLRKDLTSVINIAIDGPAGSGKSTVSAMVANRLDILYLDTGAMYRAVALKCINANTDYADNDSVKRLVAGIDIKVEYKDGKQHTLLDGVDVSDRLRTPQVSMLASFISGYSCVRNKMVSLQREIASRVSCIVDGRDIGTNVLPACPFKFFLTASAEVRAKRRYEEDRQRGSAQSFEEVLRDIKERDYQDKNRACAPLKCASDAVTIDTSDLTAEEVAEFIIRNVQSKI